MGILEGKGVGYEEQPIRELVASIAIEYGSNQWGALLLNNRRIKTDIPGSGSF